MDPNESINQSAFLNSFSAYLDCDTSAQSDIDIIADEFVEKSGSNSTIGASMNEIMNYKVEKNVPFSNVISVAKLLNKQQNAIVDIPDNSKSLKKKIANALQS